MTTHQWPVYWKLLPLGLLFQCTCFTFVYFEMDLRFLKMLLALFFLPLQTLDTLTLPYNLVQPHTINKDVMWHLESFSISDRVDYIQQMLFNYTYYFYQTRFSTVLLSVLVTRHHFVVATMNLLWYIRLKWYQKNCKSAFDKLIGGMTTLHCHIF